MTYLQVVNAVLRRLRETEVSTYNETGYSTLVGDFVNDAKKFVEQSWDWSSLRDTITVTTAASDYQYPLTGSGQDFKLLNALNSTSSTVLHYRTPQYFDSVRLTDTSEGVPSDFAYRNNDANGDVNLEVYPTPNGVYSLTFQVVKRTADFTDDADVLTVPTQAVIYMALALAARGRGEAGGTSAAELLALADTYLADAIALDASRYAEEMVWETV